MNKNIALILGIVVIAGFGFFIFSGNKVENSELMQKKIESKMGEKDESVTMATEEVVAQAGSYIAYAPEKIAMAETGDVVLFFHASWCPSCRALNSDIEKNVSTIPSRVTILKTDYDQEVELKKKHGVTTQHTLVQVDKDGNLIKKWSGGSKLENLISQIQ